MDPKWEMGTMIMTDKQKSAIHKKLPEWFKPEPGFHFLDSDGDLCMVIGWGGWRQFDLHGTVEVMCKHTKEMESHDLGELEFMPATLVGSYRYRGEWYMMSIPDMEHFDSIQPLMEHEFVPSKNGITSDPKYCFRCHLLEDCHEEKKDG